MTLSDQTTTGVSALGTHPPGESRVLVTEAAGERAATATRRVERMVALLSPFMFLLVWELASRSGLLDSRFFPPPTTILRASWEHIESGYLIENMLVSLRRVGIGFAVGVVPALSLGLVLGFSRLGRAAFLPLIQAVYPIPKSAVAPLLLLIFGFGEASKWVLVALGVFFPVFFNTMAGVLNLEKIYSEVAQNFGANRYQFIRTVALPGAMPMIMTGLRLGVGMGLLLIAVAEIIGANSGLGFMIYNAWQLFQVETMYTGLVAIALLGLSAQMIMNRIERALVPWAQH
jgi:ABC-type nitrate/sulfonate/bicarbonate transport system permease component